MPGQLISLHNQAWIGVYNIVVSIGGQIIGFVASMVGQVIGWVAQLPGQLIGLVSSAFSGMLGAAQSLGGALIGFVAGIPGQILGALGNLGGLLFDAGASIMSGLLSGIESAASSLWDFVSSIPGKIAHTLSFGLISNSPSKLMMPIGASIPQGLVAGAAGQLPGLQRFFGQTVTGTIARSLDTATFAGQRPSGSFRAFTPADRATALQASAAPAQYHTHFHDLQVRGEQDLSRIDKIVRAAARDQARALRARGTNVGLLP